MSKKIKHLIVDTNAFLKASQIQDIAENIYTVQEVVDEITNDRQRRKLVVLPYDLKIKDVFSENVKILTEFSKKTGDYTSLSATDIKVMALTYQMEKEILGTKHLKTEPTVQRTIKVTGSSNFNTGVNPNSTDTCNSDIKILGTDPKQEILKENTEETVEKSEDSTDSKLADEIAEKIKNMDLIEESESDNIIVQVPEEEVYCSEDECESSDENDDDDWITPANIKQKKQEEEMGDFDDTIEFVEVACITSDFAMQNVLKQIGLKVTSVDGRIIKHLRTFIFRCTTCFKTTSVMTKMFCPKCGHASLKKVSVSIDDNGIQHIHINGRKPLTARGKKFSLPTPKGGQHFQYPILTEDQHIHKSFATKLGRSKTNALDQDYIAGFSPFVMRDVNSRSALLGIRANTQDVKYWTKHYAKGKRK